MENWVKIKEKWGVGATFLWKRFIGVYFCRIFANG